MGWSRLGNRGFKWKILKRGMTKFPKNPDGTYNHEITYNGRRLKAKAEIVRYLALDAGKRQRPVSGNGIGNLTDHQCGKGR